jgi:hypothetical protein
MDESKYFPHILAPISAPASWRALKKPMILLHFKVKQTQNILGERQGKIDSNIDEVNIEKIIISQATPIHCSDQGRKVQSMIQAR